MKRTGYVVLVTILLSAFGAGTVQAQMINYERRNKNLGKATAPAPAAKPYTPPAAMSPMVNNSTERRYDANRDGRLQTSEMKRFLADVLLQVQRSGRYVIDSDLLKKYDANGDGIIGRYELNSLREDSR